MKNVEAGTVLNMSRKIIPEFWYSNGKGTVNFAKVAHETVLGTSSSKHICDLKPGRFTVFRQVMSDKKEGPFP